MMIHWLQRIDAARARRTLLIIFCAFVIYALACLAFGSATDPRAPFDTIAQSHTEISLLFGIIGYSFDLACLAVLVGGLPMLFDIVRSAIVQRRTGLLWLLSIPLIALPAVIVYNWIVFQFVIPGGITTTNATPLHLALNATAQGLALLVALASVVALALVVARSEINPRLLRFALAPAAVVILAMAVTLLAVIIWSVRLSTDAPQLFKSQALATAGLSGLAVVVVVAIVMALPTGFALLAYIRNLSRPSAGPAL